MDLTCRKIDFIETELKMVTVQSSLQIWWHHTLDKQEPNLCWTHPPPKHVEVLPFLWGTMSLADTTHTCRCLTAALSLQQLVLDTAVQHPPLFLLWYLPCLLMASYFRASCLSGCGCPLCSVLGEWPALREAQSGHAANVAAEVRSVWGSLLATKVENLFYAFLKAVTVVEMDILGQGELRQSCHLSWRGRTWLHLHVQNNLLL